MRKELGVVCAATEFLQERRRRLCRTRCFGEEELVEALK